MPDALPLIPPPPEWIGRERELRNAHADALKMLADDAQAAKTDGGLKLDRRSRRVSQIVDRQIRAACLAEKALDLHDGTFKDVLAIVAPQVRPDLVRDGAGGQRVRLYVVGDDGKPRHTSSGKLMTIQQAVAALLIDKPHFRKSSFNPGPGAGQSRPPSPAGAGRAPVTPKNTLRKAFGL